MKTRGETRAVVRAVLAADCACAEEAFVDDGLLVTAAEALPGRRRYPLPGKQLLIVTMGRGVVVSCHADWVTPLRSMLGDRSRDALFAAATIAELAKFVASEGEEEELRGPAVSYACAPETLRAAEAPDGVVIEVMEGQVVLELYRHPGFSHALSYQPDHPRPDVAAAVARREGAIVGIAGMSADSDSLWQIGIDVVASERGTGVGRALVSRLTEVAFRHGRVPSYSVDIANLRSHALAVSLGYWPAWVELFAREPANE